MKSELLATSPLLILPLVALFLFITVFVGVFIVTMKKRIPAYDAVARLPLDDDDQMASPTPRSETKGSDS